MEKMRKKVILTVIALLFAVSFTPLLPRSPRFTPFRCLAFNGTRVGEEWERWKNQHPQKMPSPEGEGVTGFTALTLGETLKVGTAAPPFKVKSGCGKILSLDMIKGKVIVLFYETKDVVEKNRKLKDELNKLYDTLPDTAKEFIVKLPIINCRGAFWPFTIIWRNKLIENSKKEGITIYGDWDGRMFIDYKMKDRESNVIIIDKNGIIRYVAFGKVRDEESSKIKELLKSCNKYD